MNTENTTKARTGGARLQKPDRSVSAKRRGKGPLIAGIVAAVAAAGYIGLCALASGTTYYPNTRINDCDASGMTVTQAAAVLKQELSHRACTLYLQHQEQPAASVTLHEASLTEGADFTAMAQEAYDAQQGKNFFLRGASYVRSVLGGSRYTPAPALDEAALDEFSQAMAQSLAQGEAALTQTEH